MIAFFLTMPIKQDDADQRHERQVLACDLERQRRADAGRGQRRQNREGMDQAFVEDAEHDVDRDDRRQNEPRLALQRFREFGRVAVEGSGHRRRQVDGLLRRVDRRKRVAERGVGCQIEADRDSRELILMADRERRRLELHRRDGGQQNLCPGCASRDVEAAQARRVAAIFGCRFEHDTVLVGLRVNGRDLALSKGVAQRIVDGLHRDAETSGRDAIDGHPGDEAAVDFLRGDIPERRRGLQCIGHLFRPLGHFSHVRARKRVLIAGAARLRRDLNILDGLEVDDRAGNGPDRMFQALDDLSDIRLPLGSRLQHDLEVADVLRGIELADADDRGNAGDIGIMGDDRRDVVL